MATTLETAMESMQGVGKKEQYRLASFLERNQIRGAKAMNEVLYGSDGFVAKARELNDSLDNHGKEMLGKITDLFKDSVGKSASETRDILTKMRVVQQTLSKSGDKQSKQLSKLIDAGGIQQLEKQGSLGNVFKDVVRGKVAGFKDRMIRKIPLVGGLAADVFKERKRRKGIVADQKAALETSGEGVVPDVAPAAAAGEEGVAPAAAAGEEGVAPAAGEKPKKKGIAGKVKGMIGIRKKSPEEKVHIRILGVLKRIDKNTRRKREDKLEKREGILERLKKSKPMKAVNNFFGGGGDSIIDDILGTALGGLIGVAAGGLVGILTGSLSALAGMASFLAPVVIPLLAVAGVAAAAYALGSFIYDKLGIDKAITEGAEKGTAGMLKGITKNEEISTSDDSKIYKDEQGQMTTERFSPEMKASMEEQEISEDSAEAEGYERELVERIAMTKGGLALDYDQNTEAFQRMMSGELTGEQFLQAEKAARRKEGEGPNKMFLRLYQDVLNADTSMRDEWEDFNRRYESGDLSSWGFTKGDWASFVNGVVATNTSARKSILMTERSGNISKKEADALLSMSPFIGRDWEPQHNDTMTGLTTSDEYNMPGWWNDLNLGDDLKDYKTYPKASDSPAAMYAKGEIPQLRRGGLIAELHSGEAVIPLSKAMMDSTGTLNDGAKILMQTLMGNAIWKGTSMAETGTGVGGPSAIIAPTNTNVINQTDNIFSAAPITRNSEPSFREMQRLLYA